MTWNPELNTDALDDITYTRERLGKTYHGELAIEHWSGSYESCNSFAFAYQAQNPAAIVKVTTVTGQMHCYVYDPDLDATIDPTLGQFEACPTVGMWDGDHHPYTDDAAEIDDYNDKATFETDFDGPYSPFW